MYTFLPNHEPDSGLGPFIVGIIITIIVFAIILC